MGLHLCKWFPVTGRLGKLPFYGRMMMEKIYQIGSRIRTLAAWSRFRLPQTESQSGNYAEDSYGKRPLCRISRGRLTTKRI